ncbi:hypothetical protein EBB07_19415 [Paenibacillaceae bacterium]|nr:hypothetical protein EBB07_19415 [Paenibacillaceae bacterium]
MAQAYDEIILQGKAENLLQPHLLTEIKRGRKTKSKAQNLLARFSLYKTEIYDFSTIRVSLSITTKPSVTFAWSR